MSEPRTDYATDAARSAADAIRFEAQQARGIADAVLHVIRTCYHGASECAVRSGLQQAYERLGEVVGEG